MAITDKQQSDILKVIIGLFNAAPGKVFLTDFETQVEGGTTIAQLADGLAASTYFTDGIMGGKVATADQVAVLMNNFGVEASNVITSAGFQADFFFTARIDAGVGFGAIIFEAVTYLSGNVPLEFAATANLLTNKALVAAAYSAIHSSNDLSTLQNVVKNVTGTAPFTPDDVATFIASINDTTAPVVTAPTAPFIYAENQVGLTIATVAATDDVAVSSFQIASGNDSGFFAIDLSGKITLTSTGLTSSANDWETAPNTFTLGITAKDIAGNTSAAVNVVLEVSDVDENAPDFGAVIVTGSTAIFDFSEELSTASVPAITDFVVGLKDGSGFIAVTAVKIVGSTVELTLARAPVSGETLTITYTPGQNPLQDVTGNKVLPFAGKEVILDTTAPVITAGQTFTYVEAVAGAGPINDTADVIGKVIASDDTAITSFAITAGNDSKFFAINSKGQITLTAAGLAGAANDFEASPNSFSLTVTAQDLANNISTGQVVTITVTDNTADNGGGGGGGSDTSPQTFTLTTAADNFVGAGGNDTFNATYDAAVTDTFNNTDILAGGGGTDTLNISHLIDVAITPPDALWTGISGIENVVINTTGNGAQTIITGAAFQAAFAPAGVHLTTTTSGSGAINVTMSTFTGAATLTTTSLAGAQTIITGSGAATVSANSTAGALTIKGLGLTAVTAVTTGDGAQNIGGAGANEGENLVTVNATAAAGGQTIISTSASAVTVNATTGAGALIIKTGAGNDTITLTSTDAAGSNTITAGLGADTITLVTGPNSAPETVVIGDLDSGITLATADKVTNFATTIDKLQMGTAGTGTNYTEAAQVADFATALAAADVAMNGTIMYHMTSTAADGGLLFVDNDLNGTADSVVKLAGLSDASFAFGDIIV